MITSLKPFIPLIELSLICTLLITFILKRVINNHVTPSKKILISLGLLLILLLPLDSIFLGHLPWKLPFISYVRAATGDLSTSTLLLCLFGLGQFQHLRIKKSSIFLIGICSLIFYPLALGIGMIDPYAWGYSSPIFVGSILVLAGFLIWRGSIVEAIIISLAIIAWTLHWHESTNLWDYLIDPFLGTWAIIRSVQLILRSKSSIY